MVAMPIPDLLTSGLLQACMALGTGATDVPAPVWVFFDDNRAMPASIADTALAPRARAAAPPGAQMWGRGEGASWRRAVPFCMFLLPTYAGPAMRHRRCRSCGLRGWTRWCA